MRHFEVHAMGNWGGDAAMRVWIVACVTLLSASSTWSQTPSMGRSIEAGEPLPGNALSAGELRVCVGLSAEIDVLSTELQRLQGDVDTARSHHEHAARWLDERGSALDNTDAAAVERYNQSVDEHAQLVRTYNLLLPAFNAQVALHNVAIGKFNERCTDRPYRRKDWLELQHSD